MNSRTFPIVFVVHYTKLTERKRYLSKVLTEHLIEPNWITESGFVNFEKEKSLNGKVLGINERLVGMDLGINARSLAVTRRRARFEGYYLFLRSYLSKGNKFSTGSLPNKTELKNAWLELQRMHITALLEGIRSGREWILVLEDDAVPINNAFDKIEAIVNTVGSKYTWINLNSGAGLGRTNSEKKIDNNGLFEIKPASTRCAVAYLISQDLAKKIVGSAIEEGIPNWLPIDYYYQVLLRKFKAKSLWTEPELFQQGSETGRFQSGFENFRK